VLSELLQILSRELAQHNSSVIVTSMLHVSGIAAIGVAKCLRKRAKEVDKR
jgi:hypothetical protein